MKVTENKIYNPEIECMDRDELKALQNTKQQEEKEQEAGEKHAE